MSASQGRTIYGYRITGWEAAVRMWPEACPLWVKSEHFAPHVSVCFTPESRHVRCEDKCLLWAKSGHDSTPLFWFYSEAPSKGWPINNQINLFVCAASQVRTGKGVKTCNRTAATKITAT
jgi:hypothetical protein